MPEKVSILPLFNCAISRSGGMIGTGQSVAVIANQSADLLPAFHRASVIVAAATFTSGIIAFVKLPGASDKLQRARKQ